MKTKVYLETIIPETKDGESRSTLLGQIETKTESGMLATWIEHALNEREYEDKWILITRA